MKAVITTIQAPTPSVAKVILQLPSAEDLIVIGDKRGPHSYTAGVTFYDFERQIDQLPFRMARILPDGHYARKNLGYLIALSQNADLLYETDDDNYPLPGWMPYKSTELSEVIESQPASAPWVNAYLPFARKDGPFIWPRGLPLTHLRAEGVLSERRSRFSPVHQALVNHAPDVDAIWRAINRDPYNFAQVKTALALAPHTYCPFNSQNTWWFPEAYPLLYLPSMCSFRMTDIWRSFITERCLSEQDLNIMFHGPDARQDRNEHLLLRDFEQEVPGYINNNKLVEHLANAHLQKGRSLSTSLANLQICYETLVANRILPKTELPLVASWAEDVLSLVKI